MNTLTETEIDVPVHPVAALFPLMEGDDFTNLVNDINAHGQQVACVMLGEVLLDGRNRWRACRKLNIEPKVEQYSGQPLHVCDFILSLNIERRHLDDSQAAVIAAKAYKHFEEEAEQRRNGTQFKPGVSPNPGGKPKAQAESNSTPPEIDVKAKTARSTAGKIADKAGVSPVSRRHKT